MQPRDPDYRHQPTKRQQRVLDAIKALVTERGYAPTIRELGDRLGMTSTNAVADHLKLLKKKGCVEWERNQARTLRIVSQPEERR